MSAKKTAPSVQDSTDRFQRETNTVISDIQRCPLIHGVQVDDVVLSATTARVFHNLGRPALGFIVVGKTATADVWRDSTVTATNLYLPLKASGSVTVSLWIY